MAALTAAATMSGCGWNDDVDSRAATAGMATARQLVHEHEWVLVPADSSLTVDDDNPVTLSIVDDVVSGMAPCNAYRGEVSLGRDDEAVEISDVTLTARRCDDAAMDAEDAYIAALQAVDRVDVDEDDNERLVLTGGEVRLGFRSYDADELLARTWTIVGVATGDAIESVLAGTEPTISFDGDGDLALSTGCNIASSAWTLDGHHLALDPALLTSRACATPAGVMDQEAALVDALQTSDRVEVAPGRLMILDAGGSVTLVAADEG